MNTRETLRILSHQLAPYKKAVIGTPLCTTAEVMIDVLIPYVTAQLIDEGILLGDMQKVYHYGGMMLMLALISLCIGIVAGRLAAIASSGYACNLRKAMYRNIQRFSFANLDKFPTSSLVTRMTTDVQQMQVSLQMLLRITIRAPFRMILATVMCLFINVNTSLIFLSAMAVLSVALYFIISRVMKLFGVMLKQYDEVNSQVRENVSAIRVVKAFVREDYESLKFSKAARRLYELSLRAESLMVLNGPIMSVVSYGCIIALSWFGAQMIVVGSLTTGELASLFTYVMMILGSLMMLSMIIVQLAMASASANRIVEAIAEPPSIDSRAEGLTEVPDGRVEMRDVCFAYHEGSEEYALRHISFSIEAGKRLGIIGCTASGKSTMSMLLDRLYEATRGTVLVGGHDVRQYTIPGLRQSVAVVTQQSELFTGTVLDNLRWGKRDATLEECRQACRLADVDEFILSMSRGYDTHIEQHGANLSGGQRQRICIARALLKHPKILILDDSTSACDAITESHIRQALRSELTGMTQIIISQRVQAVEDCDQILVLDQGRLCGVGTHEELLAENSIYQDIYRLQKGEHMA